MADNHVAIRTCIGCRKRSARSELVRYVRNRSGVLVCDDTKSAQGRGAWLHDCESCREKAVQRRAFKRAFRTSEDVGFPEYKSDEKTSKVVGHVKKPITPILVRQAER